MKVVIYTMQSIAHLPPRIRMERTLLEQSGYEVEVVGSTYPKSAMPLIYKIMYYATLSFFRWDLIHLYKQQSRKGEIAIVYDLSLLPLLKILRTSFRRMIYETLDNNVALTFFHLTQRFPFIQIIGPIIKRILSTYEKKVIQRYADHLIVNSVYLSEILGDLVPTSVNIYASPFEEYDRQKSLQRGNKPAFLYLGIFSEDKGAEDVLNLQKKYSIPLFIFGDKKYDIPLSSEIKWKDRMSIDKLYHELYQLSSEYRFLGISLIKSTNESYANQEANKEADYLSIGIPFIGNQRRTTEEKILGGAGCFISQPAAIEQILFDDSHYQKMSASAKKYYSNHLSIQRFSEGLLTAVGG